MRHTLIIICSLLFLTNASTATTRINDIMVINKLNQDMAWYIESTLYSNESNRTHGVNAFGAIGYRTVNSETDVIFKIGTCDNVRTYGDNGGFCSAPSELIVCNTNHFNAEKIKNVFIDSPTSCRIVCRGDENSCKI